MAKRDKITKVTLEVQRVEGICHKCGKKIVGTSMSQVKYNLRLHDDAKHKNHKNKGGKKNE